jgi:ABC-type sulfate/molybdate transport systems ATPase subunit
MTLTVSIVIMRDGLIEQVGTPDAVFSSPRDVFRCQLYRLAASEPSRDGDHLWGDEPVDCVAPSDPLLLENAAGLTRHFDAACLHQAQQRRCLRMDVSSDKTRRRNWGLCRRMAIFYVDTRFHGFSR